MLHIKRLEDGLDVYKALGSELRIKLLRLLMEEQDLNMNELASRLGITNGALTGHVKKLEESGIIRIHSELGRHGNQKICRVNVDKILVDVDTVEDNDDQNIYNAEMPIGHYSDYNITPTCGIATKDALIGEVDDPRYFAHPDRMNARILWFTRGYVEYIIPNLLPNNTKIDKITLSFEISSEAPGVNNDWPSDITFILNDVTLGKWTSPGDYGDVQGIFTPDWWFPNWNQYGLLKMIDINKKGTFIDGLQISDVNISQFQLDYRSTLRFKFKVLDDAENIGGLTIFGGDFGNYSQDIKVRISYSQIEEKTTL